ncbi:hypothetical protein [Luteolibacter sp.]|uniref:hypothetical protein n=1 Tax=Luteolibacter sp. TaxID=1962973 RepID=UPI0032667461
MAREEKRFELRPVDEEADVRPPVVIRLESEETLQRAKPARLGVPPVENKLPQRLDLPSRDQVEMRTHQPGIEALIETDAGNPDLLEANWGAQSSHHRSIPWGWFVLIGLLLAGGVVWSLSRVNESDDKAHEIRIAAENVLIDDEKEDREAAKLIDTIHDTTRKFFDATTIDSLLKFVRQPDRVRPLMERYFADKPVASHHLREFRMLQPLTLENHGNYWMATVELDNRDRSNLLLEIMPSGEALVDWETLVCYQPMKWDDFATKKPRGASMNFRVYVEQDNFFSHEFADSDRWNCFRLTALDSDETLFGYVHSDSPLSQELIEQLQRNNGHKASMILRLVIPEGIQSHSGVIIEKLMSPRWLYMNPPESGS